MSTTNLITVHLAITIDATDLVNDKGHEHALLLMQARMDYITSDVNDWLSNDLTEVKGYPVAVRSVSVYNPPAK